MDAEETLGVVFSDALAEVIATVTSVYLQCAPSDDDAGLDDITGVMSLSSKKGGILFITANEADIRELCSCMTGAAVEELTEKDVEDTLCEFVNMTAGNAKLRLSDPDYMFTLSTPFVIKGKDMSIAAKSRTTVISRAFGNGEISLKLKFVC